MVTKVAEGARLDQLAEELSAEFGLDIAVNGDGDSIQILDNKTGVEIAPNPKRVERVVAAHRPVKVVSFVDALRAAKNFEELKSVLVSRAERGML